MIHFTTISADILQKISTKNPSLFIRVSQGSQPDNEKAETALSPLHQLNQWCDAASPLALFFVITADLIINEGHFKI